MDISSSASVPVQPIPQQTPARNDRVEGTNPDNDSDRDDNQVKAVEQASNTSQVTNNLGNNLNIIA